MAKLTKEHCPEWPEILAEAAPTDRSEPHEVDISEAGAVRQAISRSMKKDHPQMEFKTKKLKDKQGVEYLALWKTIKKSS